MNRILFTIIYYIAATFLIFIGGKIEPTNLAGPGLDMIAYFLVFITSLVLLIRDLAKIKRGKQFIISAVIHSVFVVGTITTFVVLINFPHFFNSK